MLRNTLLRTIVVVLVLAAVSAVTGVAQSDQSALAQLQTKIETLYAKLAPSVVNITNKAIGYDQFMQPVPQEGTGSGFFYDQSGLIVTNSHVVHGSRSLTVSLASGKSYPATLVGEDPSNDLAVIRIKGASLPDPLPLGDPESLKVGAFVLAIGSPFGLQRTATFGIISALGRTIQSPDNRFIGEAIQTDTAINPGNSGGPLIDLQGRVIGVNTQILSPSGANSGIGFAISTATVKRVVPQLIAKGRYQHPSLGIQGFDLTPDRAQVLRRAGQKLAVDTGVYIAQVMAKGGAERAGMRGGNRIVDLGGVQLPIGGDVITAIGGQGISTLEGLIVYLDERTTVGQVVAVSVDRDGKPVTLNVKLNERPSEQQ